MTERSASAGGAAAAVGLVALCVAAYAAYRLAQMLNPSLTPFVRYPDPSPSPTPPALCVEVDETQLGTCSYQAQRDALHASTTDSLEVRGLLLHDTTRAA